MRNVFRWVLSISVTIASGWLLVTVSHEIQNTPDQLRTVRYEESRAWAFQSMREDEKRVLDAAILLPAGLWSVAIVKRDDRIRRRAIPELIMFVVAMVLFASFFYFTQKYSNVLERAYWDTTSGNVFPDVFNSPYLSMYDRAVAKSFYGSLIVASITVFSLCVVREHSPDL